MFPSSDVLLRNLEQRIKHSLSQSLHDIAAIPSKVVLRTPSRISRQFPTIKLQVAHSPFHVYDIEALLDSGATATYISSAFVDDHRIPTRKLPHPIYAYNADDTLNATAITRQAKLVCRFRGHVSVEWFFVTDIGSKTMIIGMTWLRSHNPDIDWRTGDVSFTRCPIACLGKRSLKGTLDSMIDNASMATNPSSPYELNELRHSLSSKEHAATTWAAEDYKTKKVLTIEDIKKGPFKEFVDVFEEKNYQDLPPHRKWDHKIDLVPDWESRAWRPHTYPLSYQEQKELDAFLEENLASGRIRRSESPLASPVFFISKKDGKKRMVIDYRKLNDITVKNVYPLPRIDELIQKWKGCVRFSALDIRSGYFNVRMKEGDEWKTAFITNRGLFESLVMTFGLTNAPATFQTMMDSIFIVQIRRGDTNCFIDDIGIGTTPDPTGRLSDDEFHTVVLREVFQLCREHKLSLKPEKCLINQPGVPYLGHIISGDGIRPDPVKLAGIKDWPIPTNLKELRAYLGIMSYYRRYIKDFSNVARPLNDLLKKDAPWQWQPSQQDSYQRLKEILLSDVFLLHPTHEKPFILETDASLFAWGAVLSQEDQEGKWRPVGCVSKGFADAETRYDTHDRELLAIIRALQAFRHWLMGTKHPVTVLTDHNNLRYFQTKQILSPRQTRWMGFMTEFDLILRYRPGRQSSVPDALSRRADHEPSGAVPPAEQVLLPPSMFSDQTVNTLLTNSLAQRDYGREIYQTQSQDPLILEFNKKLEDEPLPHGWKKLEELWTYMGKIYIPPLLRQDIFREMHAKGQAAHPGIKGTTSVITTDYYWPGIRSDVKEWIKTCDTCQRMKNRTKKPHGTLKPIDPVPRFWGVVTTDLVTGLPMCKGFDAIFTATDKRGKIKHIAPTTSSLDSAGFVQLFLDNVWKLHGTSDKIISDRGPQMSSRSFHDTCRKLGIELALSTAYHPQTDGQSERTNQEVEQALRTVISFHQDDWVDWLPVIEFALNNRYHSGLKTTPFYANFGYHPHIGSLPRIQSPIESVEDFIDHLHQIQKDTEKSLEQAAEDMKRFYDRNRNPLPEYEVGQKVLLDNTNLALERPSRKLSERYSGPFEVLEKIGSPAHAYRLKLPSYWKNVHPVWNVSKIHPYHEDPKNPNHPQPPPELVEGEPEWEVEEILGSKFMHNKLVFLVRWKGYSAAEDSWQEERDLENAPAPIAEFYRKFPGAPRRLEDGSKAGKPITKRRRGRKRIGCLDHQPLLASTDVATWPTGRMTRDVSS